MYTGGIVSLVFLSHPVTLSTFRSAEPEPVVAVLIARCTLSCIFFNYTKIVIYDFKQNKKGNLVLPRAEDPFVNPTCYSTITWLADMTSPVPLREESTNIKKKQRTRMRNGILIIPTCSEKMVTLQDF